MGEIYRADRVKLIMGLIYSDEFFTAKAINMMKSEYGEIDCESEEIKFGHTDYYNEEMGDELYRKYISFEELIEPSELPSIKHYTNDLELRFSRPGCKSPVRRTNIDPGYLELSKLILASTKNFSHRIYLNNGIYGEVTLMYREGGFKDLEWTYPDYGSDFAKGFLMEVRRKYVEQLKGLQS
ncbi:MAG: DUF4416 family protein [candidate division Zixibacteria bacterium]|nr:DUF4416 family protein [candidate division Zixibacteria bacterium]